MKSAKQLSVSRAAALCRVGRTTVGYWIRSKKLYARRQGRSYSIPVEDLLVFLQSTGQPIPPELGNGDSGSPVFKSFKNCWEVPRAGDERHECGSCMTYQGQVDDCFCMRGDAASNCPYPCHACRYYQDMFLSRIRFIHQIGMPAAVFKGLYFWGGNSDWSALCGFPEEKLIGLGIEKIIHPTSLVVVISSFKKFNLARHQEMTSSRIFINTGPNEKRAVDTWVLPLREPRHTSLLVASPAEPKKTDAGSADDPTPTRSDS
jgi:excisionase family DNA binding protein